MTRGIVCIIGIMVLSLGCVSDNSGQASGKSNDGKRKFGLNPSRRFQKNEDSEHGLKYYEGIGWRYIKPGLDIEVLTYTNTQLLEYVRKAIAEKRFDDAMFGARYFIQRTPGADDVPEMRRVVAEVYESRGLEQYAFKEYQKLLDAHPGYDKSDEVSARMYEIATLYLNGKRFRWKIPFQDSIYIPLFPSMGKTSKLYTQIVTNAPFGLHAAESQYGIGQAHERALKGFWGFFADASEYDKATRAYQLLADRYSQRAGDSPRENQEKLNEMVAQARFRTAELYEAQANEGIYDQSMAERSIEAFGDFVEFYKADADREEKVTEAKAHMNAMRLERARGLKGIALFYEKKRQWVAAHTYYGQINQALIIDVLNDPDHEAEAKELQSFANKRLSEELFQWRVRDALELYAEAQKAEKKNRPFTAQREYRKVKLNLEILPADLERAAKATEIDLVRLQEIQSTVAADLERIQQLLDERELARSKED